MNANYRKQWKKTFFLFVLLALVQPALGMKEEKISLRWEALDVVVSGRKVLTILRDGTEVEGQVVSVEPDALRIELSKSSPKYPKGIRSIPRSQVGVLRFEETSGPWRLLGALMGGGGGAVAGIAVYSRFNNEANPGAGAGIAAGLIGGGAAIGYFAGRSADQKAVIISIID